MNDAIKDECSRSSSAHEDERFCDRLKIAIGSASPNAFSRVAGVSASVLRAYLAGSSEPTRPVLEALANAADVSPCWLAFGIGGRHPGADVKVNSTGQKNQDLPTFDSDLMRQIIEGIEIGLDEAGLMQPPEGKAQSILKLYDWFVEWQPNNPRQEVINLFVKGHSDRDERKDEDARAASNREGKSPKR